MAKGGGTEVTQQQSVSQQTTVSVQNVIQARALEPLERLNLLADVFAKIDAAERSNAPQAAPTIVSVQNIPGAALLKDPMILSVLIGGAAVLLLAFRR